MAHFIRCALLFPVLTATFTATAVVGENGGGPRGAPVVATSTAARSGYQENKSRPRAERQATHGAGKEDPAAWLHTSPQRQDEHQLEIRERLSRGRRRRRQQEEEEEEQQQQQQQQQHKQQQQHQHQQQGLQPTLRLQPTQWAHGPRLEDNSKNRGGGDGVHGCNEDKARRRGPLDVLAAVGDGIKTRARRSPPVVPEVAEPQQPRQRRHRVGWTGKGEVGVGRRERPLAFGNPLARNSGQEEEQEQGQELYSAERLALEAENDASVEAVMSVIESEGWDHVTNKSGVTVVRKFLPPPPKASSGGGVVDEGAAAKFACVKAMGTLDAEASELYKLFLDNERVHEYNDNCKEVRDLEQLTDDTKVSWASTPRYGPFKARDFVTAVHYRTLEDGTMVVINRPVEHPAARRGKKFVRAEILIATNIMRPNREDPRKTDFISVTHINPGGIADTTLGAKIVNKLCAKAPVNLLVALERSANSPPVPKKV